MTLAISLLSATTVHAARTAVTLGEVGPALTYVVMGDSTAAGEGGNYESGIAMATTRHLAQRFRVTMFNVSVSGSKYGDVRRDQLASAASLHPDVVLLAAAANDITHLTPTGSMQRDLRAIVQELKASNPAVRIVITGSPDMGAPPRVPWILRGLASLRTRQANRMFVREAAAMGLTFAPIAERTGPLFRRDRSFFSEDAFHPNDRGYAAWTAVIDEALDAALTR